MRRIGFAVCSLSVAALIAAVVLGGPAGAALQQGTPEASPAASPAASPVVSNDPTSMLRWLYFNGEQGQRPATLVIQVDATKGPYKGYVGTASFVSRESG